MDVRLSPEQVALRDSVAQVVERHAPRTVGALDDVERVAKLDAAVAAAGWRELRADNDGAPWASAVEAAIVAEELGRGLADVPFLGPTLAAELRRVATAPPAASTETVVFDDRLGALAEAVNDETAHALAIDAGAARSALMLDARGPNLAAVAPAPEHQRVDLTRPSAVVPAGTPIRRIDGARPISVEALTRWNALALALTSADLVGVMRGALGLACEYAKARRQYGTAIGSFQAVQHLLADALVATEGSQSAARHAAWAVDALAPDDALAAGAIAKAYCSRAARVVCETTIQVHGGIGNTWECLAHVYLRRALLSTDLLGGVGPNLERVLEHEGIGAAGGLR
jgi:alkylation response protein AidB-like acyl-CoA dehydrogenase